MDEIADALRACEELGMSPERIGHSLGAYRRAFLALGTGPRRFDVKDLQMIARRLRLAAALYLLDREGAVALHAGSRPKR